MAPPLPLPFLDKVVVSRLRFPLYNHLENPTKVHFSLENVNILDHDGIMTNGRKGLSPIAITKETEFSIQLSPQGLELIATLTPPFCLTATLESADVFKVDFVSPAVIQQFTLIQPRVQGQPKSLPWVLDGQLRWLLRGSKEDQPQYYHDVLVEIYALPETLPPYFEKQGIPLYLLRLPWYIRTWMRQVEQPLGQPAVDWPSFVVQALTSGPQLEYKDFNGVSQYTSWDPEWIGTALRAGQSIVSWLDLWLWDLYHNTLPGAKHPVDIYDLASLSQVLISLGLEYSKERTGMNYLTPFGYIKPTKLIGRIEEPPNPDNQDSMCNNPLYAVGSMYDKAMLCATDSSTRSSLDYHLFLTIQKDDSSYVLDVGCGPQTGTTTLQSYPASVIDTDARLYSPPSYPGTTQDVIHGPGVSDLAISRVFEKSKDSSAQDPRTILDKIKALLSTEGRLCEPYISVLPGKYNMMATWTLQPSSHSGALATITLFSLWSEQSIRSLFNRRRRSSSLWELTSGDPYDIFLDKTIGSLRMFADVDRHYIATIQTRHGKSDSTRSLKDKIKNVLSSSLQSPLTIPDYFDSIVQVSPVLSKEATITAKINVNGKRDVVGFHVQITQDKAVN
ncbi:hypothetical protein FOMG_16187 [Fusarium oxysporum f. sp. melonis 26406]|uniref:Uncharacterized protein n=1 Tax=Fusarium oxysporum f. sp. melonis 26406 TaxID=1089452 RepID=W9Z6G6_FUSOX|nr:hypothetical protein FOMG_16187 [Fusarium oxysporum f. sp. melonis 26406]